MDNPVAARDFRANFPRFQGDNLAANLRLVEYLKSIATSKGATVPQIAIAWVLAQGNYIDPYEGTKQRKYLMENLAAANIRLTEADVAAIEKAVPRGAVAGERYPPPGMATLNG